MTESKTEYPLEDLYNPPITDDIFTLPSNIPNLDSNGKNWVTFLFQFKNAMLRKDLWGHFNGDNKCPILPETETEVQLPTHSTKENSDNINMIQTSSSSYFFSATPNQQQTEVEIVTVRVPNTIITQRIKYWKCKDAIARTLLSTFLPDDIFLIVDYQAETAKEMWDALIKRMYCI